LTTWHVEGVAEPSQGNYEPTVSAARRQRKKEQGVRTSLKVVLSLHHNATDTNHRLALFAICPYRSSATSATTTALGEGSVVFDGLFATVNGFVECGEHFRDRVIEWLPVDLLGRAHAGRDGVDGRVHRCEAGRGGEVARWRLKVAGEGGEDVDWTG
jgi:hypothetical protein